MGLGKVRRKFFYQLPIERSLVKSNQCFPEGVAATQASCVLLPRLTETLSLAFIFFPSWVSAGLLLPCLVSSASLPLLWPKCFLQMQGQEGGTLCTLRMTLVCKISDVNKWWLSGSHRSGTSTRSPEEAIEEGGQRWWNIQRLNCSEAFRR